MKKLFAILLAVMMMVTMALPALAEGNTGTTTVYCDIGSTSLTQVYAYAWEAGNISNRNATWPGVQMTLVDGTVYKTEISSGIDMIIFHDTGSNQASDLTIPTDGKNLYIYSTGEWSTYGDVVSNTSYLNKSSGYYTIGVNGKYVAGGDAEEKISVDIAWESMIFTYTAGGSTYEPSTHKTTTTDGKWSTNKPGITVTNHSNAAIDATMSFTAGQGVTTTGSFYASADATTALAADAQKLSLESAEGKKRNDGQADDKSPKGTLYFGISGDAISEDKTLGTVTVKIAKNTWTQVGTKEAFTAAMANGGNIKLTDNIDTSDSGYVDFVTNTVLDLNGKTLTGTFGTARVAFERELKNGTLNLGWTHYVNNNQTLKLSDCTVNGGDADLGTINLAEYNATLIMSGTINLQYGVVCTDGQGNTVTCLAGTYNFDPTAYVDTASYTVSDNTDGTWTVNANS